MTLFSKLTSNTNNYWIKKDAQVNALVRTVKNTILKRASSGYTEYKLDWPEITRLVRDNHIKLPFNDSFDSLIGYRRLILIRLVDIFNSTDDFKLQKKISIRKILQDKKLYYIQMNIEYVQSDTVNTISGTSAIRFTWDKQITPDTIANGVPDNGAFANQVINKTCAVYRDQLHVEINTALRSIQLKLQAASSLI